MAKLTRTYTPKRLQLTSAATLLWALKNELDMQKWLAKHPKATPARFCISYGLRLPYNSHYICAYLKGQQLIAGLAHHMCLDCKHIQDLLHCGNCCPLDNEINDYDLIAQLKQAIKRLK